MITRATLSTIEQGLPKYRSMLAGNSAFIPTAYESIASITPTSGTLFTFSAIPQTYSSLQIRMIGRNNSGSGGISSCSMYFNGDTSSVYNGHEVTVQSGTVSAASFGPGGNLSYPLVTRNGAVANTYGVTIIDIDLYASSTQNKTVRFFSGAHDDSSGQIGICSGVYRSTTPITSISFNMSIASTFKTSFALYGIK